MNADVPVVITVTATKGESTETGTATVVVKKAEAEVITVNHVDVQQTGDALNFTGTELNLTAKAYKAAGTDAENFYTQAVKALFTDEEAKIFAKN